MASLDIFDESDDAERPDNEQLRTERAASSSVNTPHNWSPAEKRVVCGLAILASLVVATVLWQVAVRDAMNSIRTLAIWKRTAPLPVAAIAPAFSADQTIRFGSDSVSRAASGLTGLPATSRSDTQTELLPPGLEAPVNAAEKAVPRAEEPEERALEIGRVRNNETAVARVAPIREADAEMKPLPGAPLPPSINLLESAAQLVSDGWQDFHYPVTWFASESSRERVRYQSHRTRLLNAITPTRASQSSLDELRTNYASAREAFRDDPRLDYAFGLALWQHGQRAEAIEAFQSAARLEETPFLPAALAVGWARIIEGNGRRGLDQLNHVAKLLKSTEGAAYPTATQRENAALFLGRAFGYLSGPGYTADLAEKAELTAFNIRNKLPQDLLAAFEDGFQQVGQRDSNLRQQATLPENAVALEHRRQSSELRSQIESLRDTMKLAKQEIAADHQSHLDRVTQILLDALKIRAESSTLATWAVQLKESIMDFSQSKPHVVARAPNGELASVASGNGNRNGSPTNGVSAPESNGSRSGPTGASSSLNRGYGGGIGSNGMNSGYGSSSGTGANRSGRNSPQGQQSRPQILLMPETMIERAERMAQLNKARTELKRIDGELASLREKHRKLIASRRELDREQNELTLEQRRQLGDSNRECRRLESRLKELTIALQQVQEFQGALDSIAAHIPWNVSAEGVALKNSLAKEKASPIAIRSSKDE